MEHISKHFNFRYHDVFRFYAQQGLVPLDREYYSGHICFGIHQALEQPCRYITLLRNPVARIVSYYNLIHSLGHFPGTLADFLNSQRYEVDNYQVRCLCVGGWTAGQATSEMLEEAQENLMRHCLFGVAERMDDSLRIIARSLEIPPPPAPLRLNRTAAAAPIPCGGGKTFRDLVTDISAATRNTILAKNELDTKLHTFAMQRLEERCRSGHRHGLLPFRLPSWLRRAG